MNHSPFAVFARSAASAIAPRPWLAAAALAVAIGALPAHAKLPPPTPEQQQAADAKKTREAEEAKRQAEALTKVQDTIAARFGKGQTTPTAGTSPGDIPQKAVEAPGTSGPRGGTAPSAEAHSGEAQRR
jgi:hypothetical protein